MNSAMERKRPTPEQIKEAREWFTENQLMNLENDEYKHTTNMVRVLLAATEPPTDEEIAAACVGENGYSPDGRMFNELVSRELSDIKANCSWAWTAKAARVIRHFLGTPEKQ